MNSSKYRWYNSNIPPDLDALYRRLKEKRYSGNGRGFEIIDFSPDRVVVKFIEKKIQEEVALDPYGEKTTFKSIQYIIFDIEFILFGGGLILIRAANPPRSIKGFLSLLEEIMVGRVIVSSLTINISDFYQFILELKIIRQLKVTKAIVCNIPFNRNTFAKIELTSSANAIEEFREKYKSENFSLAKIVLISRMSGEDEFAEISQNGAISCSKQFLIVVDSYIGDSLLKENRGLDLEK